MRWKGKRRSSAAASSNSGSNACARRHAPYCSTCCKPFLSLQLSPCARGCNVWSWVRRSAKGSVLSCDRNAAERAVMSRWSFTQPTFDIMNDSCPGT